MEANIAEWKGVIAMTSTLFLVLGLIQYALYSVMSDHDILKSAIYDPETPFVISIVLNMIEQMVFSNR